MAKQTKGTDKSKVQGLTRIQFLSEVQAVINSEALSQPKAYEIVELSYIKRFGMRKYVNYDSFYYTNYLTMIKEMRARAVNKEVLNTIYDLANLHKDGSITTPDFVKEIEPYLKKL